MKVFLDDERNWHQAGVTVDWIQTFTPEATIALLETGLVDEVSLDNDLGLAPYPDGKPREGYNVFKWIEYKVATDDTYQPPFIHLHTANLAEERKMRLGLESIARMLASRTKSA